MKSTVPNKEGAELEAKLKGNEKEGAEDRRRVNKDIDRERGARWVFNLFQRIESFDVYYIFLVFDDLPTYN
jgi:hypothetical protein